MAGRSDGGADLWSALVLAGLAPRTVALYQRTIWSAEEWFAARGWDLANASVAEVVAYMGTKPNSYASRGLLRCALKHYWRVVDHPSPPVSAIRLPPTPKMVCRAMEPHDAHLLAKEIRRRRDRMGLATALGLYQGMRREEIASLPWSAFRDGWVEVVGKGERRRTIPVHPVVEELLAEAPRQGDWVFMGHKRRHVSPATVWGWIRRVGDDAGIGHLEPHELRHTALATANDSTGDLRAVQEFAGHSNPQITAGYTRATAERLRKVVRSIDY